SPLRQGEGGPSRSKRSDRRCSREKGRGGHRDVGCCSEPCARTLAVPIFERMRFWRSIPGAIVLVLLFGVTAAVGMASAQVYRVTHPSRQQESASNLGAALAKAEDV